MSRAIDPRYCGSQLPREFFNKPMTFQHLAAVSQKCCYPLFSDRNLVGQSRPSPPPMGQSLNNNAPGSPGGSSSYSTGGDMGSSCMPDQWVLHNSMARFRPAVMLDVSARAIARPSECPPGYQYEIIDIQTYLPQIDNCPKPGPPQCQLICSPDPFVMGPQMMVQQMCAPQMYGPQMIDPQMYGPQMMGQEMGGSRVTGPQMGRSSMPYGAFNPCCPPPIMNQQNNCEYLPNQFGLNGQSFGPQSAKQPYLSSAGMGGGGSTCCTNDICGDECLRKILNLCGNSISSASDLLSNNNRNFYRKILPYCPPKVRSYPQRQPNYRSSCSNFRSSCFSNNNSKIETECQLGPREDLTNLCSKAELKQSHNFLPTFFEEIRTADKIAKLTPRSSPPPEIWKPIPHRLALAVELQNFEEILGNKSDLQMLDKDGYSKRSGNSRCCCNFGCLNLNNNSSYTYSYESDSRSETGSDSYTSSFDYDNDYDYNSSYDYGSSSYYGSGSKEDSGSKKGSKQVARSKKSSATEFEDHVSPSGYLSEGFATEDLEEGDQILMGEVPIRAREPRDAEEIIEEFRETTTTFLKDLYCLETLTDITVCVRGVPFKAHRVVLACHSQVFRDHLIPSDNCSPSPGFVQVDNVDPQIFKQILKYMYSGEVNGNECSLADIYSAARQLKMATLEQLCCDLISDRGSACWLGSVAVKNPSGKGLGDPFSLPCGQDNSEEAKKMWCTVARYFTDIVHSEEYLKLDGRCVQALLGRPDLMIPSELTILEAVLDWVDHDRTSRMRWMPCLMKCVHFERLTPQELEYFISIGGYLLEFPSIDAAIRQAKWYHQYKRLQNIFQLECGRQFPYNCLGSSPPLEPASMFPEPLPVPLPAQQAPPQGSPYPDIMVMPQLACPQPIYGPQNPFGPQIPYGPQVPFGPQIPCGPQIPGGPQIIDSFVPHAPTPHQSPAGSVHSSHTGSYHPSLSPPGSVRNT